jgi:hypothetical protein
VWINVDLASGTKDWLGDESFRVQEFTPSRTITSSAAIATYYIYKSPTGTWYSSDTEPNPATTYSPCRGFGVYEQDFYNQNCQGGLLPTFDVTVRLTIV